MCPLRLILIFLSATLAGFFVLRNLKSQPSDLLNSDEPSSSEETADDSEYASLPRSKKVLCGISSGFWTVVDMASGKYLWRHLSSSAKQA